VTSQSEVEPGSPQRLDKWLWFARVLKSRTLAAKLVADGGVRLNRERVEKPSAMVRPGDVLTIAVHDQVRILKVVAAGERRGPAPEAALLFEDLSPPREPRSERLAGPADRAPGAGRPTKRERRLTDRLRDDPEWSSDGSD
jgi:ribosome-associated heat shock protein Hsp15